jgi:hypothetical protein
MTKAQAGAGEADVSWIEAEKDYRLALDGGKLVCQNPKGKRLAQVPKWLKEGEAAQQLSALRDWLSEHEQECRETVETWMLRSLPVPRSVLAATWPDPAWAEELQNLVVCAVDRKGEPDQEQAGFLRDADAKKGIGIVDLDGETQWIKTERIAVPHPILLGELNDFRELATELNFQQRIDQLFRETWFPDKELNQATSIDQFAQGKFEQLNHVLGLCRRLGYRVRGGNAVCPVWEKGVLVEARYWVGSEYPESETWTGELLFTDSKERAIPIEDVGPVAFSEGMRMAAAIYAKRVVEEEDEDD